MISTAAKTLVKRQKVSERERSGIFLLLVIWNLFKVSAHILTWPIYKSPMKAMFRSLASTRLFFISRCLSLSHSPSLCLLQWYFQGDWYPHFLQSTHLIGGRRRRQEARGRNLVMSSQLCSSLSLFLCFSRFCWEDRQSWLHDDGHHHSHHLFSFQPITKVFNQTSLYHSQLVDRHSHSTACFSSNRE